MLRIWSLLAALVVCAPSSAHDAYPFPCCGEKDCGPIEKLIVLPNGDRIITIKLFHGLAYRTAIFPASQQSQPPIDARDHACIDFMRKPLCLFLNGGV